MAVKLWAPLFAALAGTAHAQLLCANRTTLEGLAASNQAVPGEEEQHTASGFAHPTLCDSNVKQTSGYIRAGLTTKYFFWLFEAKTSPETAPLLMWLSGGPGCSSQLALFAENGPCKVDKDGSTTHANPASWHNAANVMWVDQPAGVGFSTSLGTHDEKGVAVNMYEFLQGFFTEFKQYQTRDFYIFGESYAGHYVPAIAHQIWRENKAGNGLHIPMKGIAIGNGLTNPAEQYKWYPEMGHFGGRKEGGHAPAGVIKTPAYDLQRVLLPACELGIAACNKGIDPDPQSGAVVNFTACLAAYDACNLMGILPYEGTGRNPYDMRIPCEHGNLCYDFDMIGKYLNRPDVKKALGVNKHWMSCNYAVDISFVLAGDWLIGYHTLLPDLLADNIQVLIYAGDVDYICNWLGNKAWTLKLQWEHSAEFNAAEDKAWMLDGKTVARLRSAKGLHFMQVYEAGHMVPMDQPDVALAMVRDFVTGKMQQPDPADLII